MESSHRQILRSSSIIGGASVINILVGLVRIKVAALLLGPAGVGLIGLFQSLLATAAAVAGLGIGTSGVRQVAEAVAAGQEDKIAIARRALLTTTAALSISGAIAMWLLRAPIARHLLADPALASWVGWLGIAVALTIIGGSQLALLNGYRRVGDIARVTVLSAMLGTIAGVTALAIWREAGIILYVIAAPLSLVLAGCLMALRVPKPTSAASIAEVWAGSSAMVRLGATFMLAGLASTGALLIARAIVGREAGAAALGDFTAAWTVSMTYIGFVLQAMATDYYPRLASSMDDHAAANRLVNEQSEIALILTAPILLGLQAGAPWIVRLLYSSEFSGAVEILRWQIMGDVLKIASWPLGFILAASGRGRAFLLSEVTVWSAFVGFVWLGIGGLGPEATGIGFFVMYAGYLPFVYVLARRQTGFGWTKRIFLTTFTLFLGVAAVAVTGWTSPLYGLIWGAVLGVGSGCYMLLRLKEIGVLPGPAGALMKRFAD